MKKLLLPLLVACILALPARAQTVLVVDVSGVFNNLNEVKTQLTKLSSAADEYRTFLQDRLTKIIDLKKNVDDLEVQANNPAIPVDSRDTYRKEYATKAAMLNQLQQEAQAFQTQSNGMIQESQENLVKLQLGKIRTVVNQIAKDKKASLVLNSSDLTMLSSVLYSDKTLDISQDVIAKLNADFTASSAASAAASAATATSTAKPAASTTK